MKDKGFTLVELAVVIVLLGIVGAVLMPRFLDTSEQAFTARMQALAGSLRAAVQLYHTAWQLEQPNGASVDLASHGLGQLDANQFGFPVSGSRDQSTTGRDLDCADVWQGLLNPAPSITPADPTKEQGTTIHHIEPKLGGLYDFVGGQDASIPDPGIAIAFSDNAQVCQYISLHFGSVAPGAPKPTIYYDTVTGNVLLDLDRVF